MDKDKAIKEIKQLKELLDNGILTQEEYDKKSSDLKNYLFINKTIRTIFNRDTESSK